MVQYIMFIKFHTEEDVATILHKGLVDGIRQNLKAKLFQIVEKEIDGVIDQTLNQLKGHVEAQRDSHSDRVVFNIAINGVPKS